MGTSRGGRAGSPATCAGEIKGFLFWVKRSRAKLSQDVCRERNVGRHSSLLCNRVITVWEKQIYSAHVETGREGRESPGRKVYRRCLWCRGPGWECLGPASRRGRPSLHAVSQRERDVTERRPARRAQAPSKDRIPAEKSTTHNTLQGLLLEIHIWSLSPAPGS